MVPILSNKDTGKILTDSIVPNKTSEFVIHEPGEYEGGDFFYHCSLDCLYLHLLLPLLYL